jgi:nucleoid-associated protein YgaU
MLSIWRRIHMADNLENLKQKYQTAFRAMQDQQVRLQNVNMQGDKLYVRGEAPSQDAKNKVWDQIKLIDSSYSDLICDITVAAAPATAPAQERTMGASAGSSGHETYTVKAGDTLSKIAQHFYNDAKEYDRIFQANRDKLSDPNRIQVGQQLVIPAKDM